MRSVRELESTLRRIDRRGCKAYKDIEGEYDFGRYILSIDHVQGDPFASPSIARVRIPQGVARFPAELHSSRSRKITLEEALDAVDERIEKDGLEGMVLRFTGDYARPRRYEIAAAINRFRLLQCR